MGELLNLFSTGFLPNIVQINLQDGPNLCTGSIITPQLILTAAICVYQTDVLANLSVIAGKSFSGEDSGKEQVRSVREIIIHEKYAPFLVEYNLALLILDKALTFTDAVQNFDLPTKDSIFSETGTLVGWRLKQKELYVSSLSIKSQESCEAYWNDTLQSQFQRNLNTETIFCAEKAQQGPCFGDEGLPLICTVKDDPKNQPYLCGIVSLADENCTTGFLTDIRKYPEWIVGSISTLVQLFSESSPQLYFKCSNDAFVNKTLKCDGYDDCGDGSDEDQEICLDQKYFSHTDHELNAAELVDFHPCYTNSTVPSVYKYIPGSSVCNGIKDCLLGSDEKNCRGCKEGAIPCKNNQCVPASSKCNGVADCEDGSDETFCNEEFNSIDECAFKCRQSHKCISLDRFCDGTDDCGDNSDEECYQILKQLMLKVK